MQELAKTVPIMDTSDFAGPSRLTPIKESDWAREKVLNWINSDSMDDNKCANLLREMELTHDENAEEKEEDFALAEEIRQESFQLEADTVGLDHKQKSSWGPICGTRQSQRVPPNGLSIMQIAQQAKAKKNLEGGVNSKAKLSGVETNPELTEELRPALQGSHEGDGWLVLLDGSEHYQGLAEARMWLSKTGATSSAKLPRLGQEDEPRSPDSKKLAGAGTWSSYIDSGVCS